MIQNYSLFQEGINIANMPLGLAFTNGIVFTSDQRKQSMPINDFTIKLNEIKPEISNPLEYSWLFFATKANISLDDLYGSKESPTLKGIDQHPGISLEDKALDIPTNLLRSNYYIHTDAGGMESPRYRNIYKHSLNDNNIEKLSEQDNTRLAEIDSHLNERGMLDVFKSIIQNHHIKDNKFLLEERATVFLQKLFNDILPLNDTKKLNFFKQILDQHKFRDYDFKFQGGMEDVFEGLNELYKRLNDFVITNKLSEEKHTELESKLITVLQNQIYNIHNLRIVEERIWEILEYSISKGANLDEQLEYIADSHLIGSLYEEYVIAKNLGVSIIHDLSLIHI